MTELVETGYVVEIEDHKEELIGSIMLKLDSLPPSSLASTGCICRVPEKFRKSNGDAYEPELVAIGPYHRGRPKLQAMEEYKWRYVQAMLHRSDKIEDKLQNYLNILHTNEPKARKCYSADCMNLSIKEFVEMMLVDGLFIIELFLRNNLVVAADADDSIYNTNWMMASLVHDLILLENQLPMFILEALFGQSGFADQSLIHLALVFFNDLMPREKPLTCDRKCEHLLDLLGNSFDVMPQGIKRKPHRLTRKYLPSVTQLRKAGVDFKIGKCKSFLDIKFRNGVLEIPQLIIQDQTDSFLRNVIAWEQCREGHETYITSYAFLMDALINSTDDVELLCRRGIIVNYLGDEEIVSALFNKLCIEVTLKKFYYKEICDEVHAYYSTRYNFWVASLWHKHLNSPWKIISVSVGTYIILITTLGVIFTILSFVIHKS